MLTAALIAQKRTLRNAVRQTRTFGSSRQYGAKGLLGVLSKKQKGRWELPEAPHLPSQWKGNARKLKEALFTNEDPGKVANLVLRLVDDAPDKKFPPAYIPLIETALRVDSGTQTKAYSVESLQRIYRSLVVSDTSRQSVITRLYMGLHDSDQLSSEDSVTNGLLYAKFLRKNGLNLESSKLLTAVLNAHCAGMTDEIATTVLESLKEPEADLDTIRVVVDNLGPGIGLSVYHDAILMFVDQATRLNEAGRREVSQNRTSDLKVASSAGTETGLDIISGEARSIQDIFMAFMNSILWGNKRLQPNTETMIIALDACLSLDAHIAGKRILRTLVLPRLGDVRMDDREALLQFYELLLLAVTKFADELATGERVVSLILDGYDPSEFAKETWDVLTQWTVYSSNDLEAVKTIALSMKHNGHAPNEETLNAALAVAIRSAKRSDIYSKSLVDFFSNEFGVDRNAETFALQIDRAVAAYNSDLGKQLYLESVKSGVDWLADDAKHIGSVHRLLVSMCTSPPVSPEDVFEVYQSLTMYKTVLSYGAQVEILKMLLGRKNLGDVKRFLTEQFGTDPGLSHSSVPRIYQELFDAVVTTSDYNRGWELYGILNKTIKLPYESYFPVMARFCEIGRPDAALLIFRYMKTRHTNEGFLAPSREIYVLLFDEFSKWMYEDGVRELADHFRLDVSMDLDSVVLSSMLSAYCQLEDGFSTEIVWRDIVSTGVVSSPDITTMIKHYTRESLVEVESFWGSFVQRFNLQPTEANIRQYIIANCYHGYYLRALEIARTMAKHYGIEPSKETIEALYNWSLVQNRKDQVRAWAIESHPEEWAALEAGGTLNSYVLPESTTDNPDHLRMEAIDSIENESRIMKS